MNTKHVLAAFAALAIAGTASAATIKVDGDLLSGDSPFAITSSTGTLQFDASLMGALGTAGINFSAVAPALYDSTDAQVSTTISSFTYESTTGAFSSVTLAGGGKFAMPTTKFVFGIRVGGPGDVSLTDLTINLGSKTVSAFVSGANGVVSGTYDIFSFASSTGDTAITGAGSYSFATSGLSLTTKGVDLISQGLKLSATGKNILSDVESFGTLAGTVAVTAVPEPSTYALLGAGLLAVGSIARRRRNAAND